MKYKFKEIMKTKRGALHKDLMSRFFYQYLSNIFLWLFLNLKISANGVGFIMALISLVAAGFYLTGIKTYLIIGSILFIVAIVLDHTDGDVARITKVFSKKGIYLDHIHHSCEEIFTFVGLGIYLTKINSNINYFIVGLIITLLLWITTYFRATMFWFLKKEGYYDSKYRKLPFVLLYGDFFKIWHFLILFSLLVGLEYYVLMIALVWSIIRFFPRMYVFYKECDMYDKNQQS